MCALFKADANCLYYLQVLSDDEKRSIYDRFGEAGLKGAGGAGGTGVSYLVYIPEACIFLLAVTCVLHPLF